MKSRMLTLAALTAILAGALAAADPQLLNLAMPDAKAMAGVNVAQAKTTPFGLYVLAQLQSHDSLIQNLALLTGFDPRRDVSELLVASRGIPGEKAGLALARGAFDPAKIGAAAGLKGGVSETYQGVTILEDPKQTRGMAFLDTTLVVAGSVDDVKAAIDRRTAPSSIDPALAAMVKHWSTSEDAWAVSIVPPASLKPPAVGGVTQNNAFQNIQQGGVGVKFGASAVVNAEAQADTPQNATAMGDVLKFLASMAQLQANNNPAAAALAQSLVIKVSGATLSVSLSLPEDQIEKAFQAKHRPASRERQEPAPAK